ncbi:hypothetical protein NZD88_17165 [Chryseobacterium antibioticum]|uniref:Uncharacterized protein n=1 Tax=Chryseobacterium pyrolae TaxID=2987481 RepID=A0ABT2IM29_9FLAO|nr:hypothetical protein [Chryseobacterium pyrolae]MCT2409282.1 hypothetical protein [Chryseobacterium pyrolae]
MSNKKFCCEKFEFRYDGEKTMGLNFRIVKYNEKFLEKEAELYNKKIEDIFDKAYFVTDGYNGLITDFSIKKMVINHCPFCGQKLRDFYKSDDYVQETIG